MRTDMHSLPNALIFTGFVACLLENQLCSFSYKSLVQLGKQGLQLGWLETMLRLFTGYIKMVVYNSRKVLCSA